MRLKHERTPAHLRCTVHRDGQPVGVMTRLVYRGCNVWMGYTLPRWAYRGTYKGEPREAAAYLFPPEAAPVAVAEWTPG